MPVTPNDPHHDAWHWQAQYTDGTALDEYDPQTGEARGFAQMDLARLSAFVLIPQREGLTAHVVKLAPGSGARLIFFRRRRLSVSIETGQSAALTTIHALGFQHTIGRGQSRRNLASFTFLFEDGSVVVTDDRDAV